MTTILTEDSKASLMQEKPREMANKNWSLFKISRENLDMSHSDIEQGFKRSHFRPNKNTALSLLAIILATTCIAIEIWKSYRVLENSCKIQILKRELEILKHRSLEPHLFDEVKGFAQRLYASKYGNKNSNLEEEEEDDEEDTYDWYYDEEYSGDYQSGSDNGSKSQTNLLFNPGKNLKEPATGVKESQENKNIRGNQSSTDRERIKKEELENFQGKVENETHTTKKRSVQEDDYDQHFILMHYPYNRSFTNNTEERQHRQRGLKDKHSPKKYHTQSIEESHVYLSPSFLNSMNNKNKDNPEVEGNLNVGRDDRKLFTRENHTSKKRKALQKQKNESSLRLQRREMSTPRHLRPPRQVYAVHYEADSTLFSSEDEHTGNGRAKHVLGVFKAWRASNWVQDFNGNNHFTLSTDGVLTIHEPGLYLAYAQIHYLDEHDENGFNMLVNGRSLFQCMVYSPGFGHKSRSCFSAQVTVLKSGDRIVLKDVALGRYTLFQRDKSFFGLVKLGEVRPGPQRHQTPL